MTISTPAPTRLRALAVALAMIAAPAVLSAQATASGPATSGALYDELARQDSLLFDAVFVSCDAAKANAMLTDDVEFYHDVTGAAAGDSVRAQFTQVTASCPAKNGVRRVLAEGSLRAYPMNHYGAVQTGTHRFVNRNGEPAGVAMFTHLWRRVNGEWKLARVVSYDHRVDDAPAPGTARRN